jgi:hypothetical protein
LLVDTEGLVLEAKVHVANVVDQEGIKPLLDSARELFPRLSHLWLDAGYRGEEKGKGWVARILGWRWRPRFRWRRPTGCSRRWPRRATSKSRQSVAGSSTPSGKGTGRHRMDARGPIESLKRWLLPGSFGGWVLAALLLVVLVCAWAYSARDDLYRTFLGLQPDAQQVGKTAYVAGERLELKKTAGGARVTLTSVYAEERRVIVGCEVEDLQEARRVAGHPAELQPLLGFGYGKPTPREEKYLKKHGLGTDVVALTDQSGTDFRMSDNSGATSEGPDNMVEGPLQNMVAFKPDQSLEPGPKHRCRLGIPLVQEAVVPPEEKRLPPETFEGKPFVFDFEIPVRPDPVGKLGPKETASDVTVTECDRRAGRKQECLQS